MYVHVCACVYLIRHWLCFCFVLSVPGYCNTEQRTEQESRHRCRSRSRSSLSTSTALLLCCCFELDQQDPQHTVLSALTSLLLLLRLLLLLWFFVCFCSFACGFLANDRLFGLCGQTIAPIAAAIKGKDTKGSKLKRSQRRRQRQQRRRPCVLDLIGFVCGDSVKSLWRSPNI